MKYVGILQASRKKQRGQVRKLNRIKKYMDEQITWRDWQGETYVYFHMPCSIDFIQSRKTSGKIKRQICQSFYDHFEKLVQTTPAWAQNCCIVCIVDYPILWESQIIIFFDPAYFNRFWNRKDACGQNWFDSTERPLSERLKINISSDIIEKGLCEEVFDETGIIYRGELWVYTFDFNKLKE